MKQRSAIVGGVLGVVLLVVVAGFAILLPKVQSDPGETGAIPALPDRLEGLVALDSDDLPSTLAQQIGARSQVLKAQKQASDSLDKVFDSTAAYRFYASTDARTFAAVTVLNGDPGLFSPDGPPVAAASAQQQPTYQLTRVRGAVCATYYAQQTTTQGQAGGPVQLSRAHCQLGANGRTYDIDARNLSLAKTVAALKQLAADD